MRLRLTTFSANVLISESKFSGTNKAGNNFIIIFKKSWIKIVFILMGKYSFLEKTDASILRKIAGGEGGQFFRGKSFKSKWVEYGGGVKFWASGGESGGVIM